MDPSTDSTLARLWADATPLAAYTEQKAERMAREALTIGSYTEARKASTIEQVARNLQFIADLAIARDKVRAATTNDLIAGRLVALGRVSNSYLFELVDASYWIGALVDWICATATREDKTVVDIRLVTPDVLQAVQPVANETAGRPSHAEVISAAIAAYAKKDPALRRPPFERHQAYRHYLSGQGYDPRRDSGFSDKTFQKYERRFRKRNK